MKKILVLGGGGFIGGHLVARLISQGHWVRSVDLKQHEYGFQASEFIQGDLSDISFCEKILYLKENQMFDEIYQLAADMGGAGYIFVGTNDASVLQNSASINLNLLRVLTNLNEKKLPKVFFSSSACIYPESIQLLPDNPGLRESDAYPANPDSEYGWEKLFSEHLYAAYARNYGLQVRIARFHNVYGPFGTWQGGREKAPAAICRKVALSEDGGTIEIWGDGLQTRSFLYIDDCLDAVQRLMESDFAEPINVGSEEIISINDLVQLTSRIANKQISIKHIPGPLGVRGRKSNNDLIRQRLKWDSKISLARGILQTYAWVEQQVKTSSQR